MPNPTRDSLLGIVFTLATVVLLVWVVGREDNRLSAQATHDHARHVERGAALYSLHCATCHGLNGEGIGALGPALNDAHFFTERLAEVGWPGTLEAYIASTVTSGRITATRPLYAGDGVAVMAAWGQEYGGPLRPDQVDAVTAFLLDWEATAIGNFVVSPLPTPTPDPVQLAAANAGGETLFVDAGCAECHTLTGVSQGGDGPPLDAIGVVAAQRVPSQSAEDYLRDSILVPNAYLVDGYAKPGACSAALSDEQLATLVAYLLTLQ